MEKEIRILVLIKTKKEDIKNNKLTIELKNLCRKTLLPTHPLAYHNDSGNTK